MSSLRYRPPVEVESDYGKEIRVFLDRLANWLLAPQNAQKAERPIFPIIWIPGCQPAVLTPFQHKLELDLAQLSDAPALFCER